MRVMGVDLGARRVGVAVSDRGGVLASPVTTIERTGDAERDLAAIVDAAVEVGAARVVVGVPVSLDGSVQAAARAALETIDALAGRLGARGIDVVATDERLTTVTAERSLREAGRSGRARRQKVDQAAAAVLLQAWLDAHPEARRER